MILIKIIMLAKINYNSGLNLLFKSHDLSKTCPMKKGFGFGQVLDRVLDKCPKRPIVQLPNTAVSLGTKQNLKIPFFANISQSTSPI